MVEQLNANLLDEGPSAHLSVFHGYGTGFLDLVVFFEEMERNWRGWEGERVWESLEGVLRIVARHSHGHVQLRVVLRHSVADGGGSGWTASVDITLDPGEQLSQVVRDVRTLATT